MDDPDPKIILRNLRSHWIAQTISKILIFSTLVLTIAPTQAYSKDLLGCSKLVGFLGRVLKRDISKDPTVAKRFVGIRKAGQIFNPLNYRKVKNPLPNLGRLKFFDQEERIPLLVRYIHDVAEGEDASVDLKTADYLYWIIEEAVHLNGKNPLDPANAMAIYGRVDPSIDNVFDELNNNYNRGRNYGALLRDADTMSVWHPAAERGMRVGRWMANHAVSIFFISSGIAVVTAFGSGVFMGIQAWAQQESFKAKHQVTYGGGDSLPDTDIQLEKAIDEYVSRHQASFNFLRSSARDDIVHFPSTVATIGIAIDNAHYIHKDAELERAYLRILYDIDRIIKDFSGSKLGQATKIVIERIFAIYDADGSIRRQFDSDAFNLSASK